MSLFSPRISAASHVNLCFSEPFRWLRGCCGGSARASSSAQPTQQPLAVAAVDYPILTFFSDFCDARFYVFGGVCCHDPGFRAGQRCQFSPVFFCSTPQSDTEIRYQTLFFSRGESSRQIVSLTDSSSSSIFRFCGFGSY
jgi:hypothetical protein